jgi:hypothetical protein
MSGTGVGVEPQTYALRGCRPAPPGAPPALIAHQAAYTHRPNWAKRNTDRESRRDPRPHWWAGHGLLGPTPLEIIQPESS